MYSLQLKHPNTDLKPSSVLIHPNRYVELSLFSLWSDDFYYFEIITQRMSCFNWAQPSVQLVFYKSPVSFPELNVYCMFMIFLVYVSFSFWTIEIYPWFFIVDCPFFIKVQLLIQIIFNIVEFCLIVYE